MRNLTVAEVNISSATTTQIIPAPAGRRIYVYSVFLLVNGANTLTFASGSTPIIPVNGYVLTSSGSLNLDLRGRPWFSTASGAGLSLITSTAAAVSGFIEYDQ